MPTADAAGKFTVFNIKGNRLRLRKPVTLLLEILNQQRQQLCQYQTGRVSSGDDDASNQDIVGVGERFRRGFPSPRGKGRWASRILARASETVLP